MRRVPNPLRGAWKSRAPKRALACIKIGPYVLGVTTLAALVVVVAMTAGPARGVVVARVPRPAITVACGTATASTVIANDEWATKVIYDDENHGWEVSADAAHVTGATDLITAVADDDAAATLRAVTRIVFTPHWHIVRLRVLTRSGRLLADVGGPYVIAPITGKLESHGAVVGTYVMSVQDDVGYEKLVTRFTHLPIELYRDGRAIMGRNWPQSQLPASLPADGTTITVGAVSSEIASFGVNQFPSGTARVVLAIPKPSAALATQSCPVVSARTFGAIAEDIAELFDLPASFKSRVPIDQEYRHFVDVEIGFGPKYVFVRDAESQVADTLASAPARIPTSGSFVYDGQSWNVFSFEPVSPTRIYLLFPAAASGAGTPYRNS